MKNEKIREIIIEKIESDARIVDSMNHEIRENIDIDGALRLKGKLLFAIREELELMHIFLKVINKFEYDLLMDKYYWGKM